MNDTKKINNSLQQITIIKSNKDYFKDFAYNEKYMRSKNKRNYTPEQIAQANSNRAKLYLLQGRIRYICLAEAKQGFDYRGKPINSNELYKFHRVCNCGVRPSKSQSGITNDIAYAERDGRGFISGLQTCGNPLVCPVCCLQYEEQKRADMKLLLDSIDYKRYQNIMLTLTFPHSKEDKISDLLPRLSKAVDYFNSKNKAPEIKANIDYLDFIKSFEAVYGKNGWHPHYHIIWTISRTADKKYVRQELTAQWFKACKYAGLIDKDPTAKQLADFKAHSLDIKFHAKTSDYLAKSANASDWGIDREMTKGNRKLRSKGLTPFQLADCNRSELFLDWVKATYRKHKIEFGKKFLDMLEILKKKEDDKAKEGLSFEELEILRLARKPVIIQTIQKNDWYNIVRFQYQSKLLKSAELANTIPDKKIAVLKIVELARKKAEQFDNNDRELEFDPDPLIQRMWQNKQMKGKDLDFIRENSKKELGKEYKEVKNYKRSEDDISDLIYTSATIKDYDDNIEYEDVDIDNVEEIESELQKLLGE
ncbi:hypothetical protein CDEF62S_03378 [Castellaniella defragrans]